MVIMIVMTMMMMMMMMIVIVRPKMIGGKNDISHNIAVNQFMLFFDEYHSYFLCLALVIYA